jgi:hypothetical protein
LEKPIFSYGGRYGQFPAVSGRSVKQAVSLTDLTFRLK